MHPALQTKARQTKPKKCRICKAQFTPDRPMQTVCGPQCALASHRKAQERAQAKRDRERKVALTPRSKLLRSAQGAFNAYVRDRDRDLPCISCGRHHQGQYHAGHYRSVGAMPSLRFNGYNVHKQCQPCNAHLSGNLIEYRIGLIHRIGLERVEWLEGPHPPKSFNPLYLRRIQAIFTKKARKLRERRE